MNNESITREEAEKRLYAIYGVASPGLLDSLFPPTEPREFIACPDSDGKYCECDCALLCEDAFKVREIL